MSLKAKLTTLFISFVLLTSILIVGVLSARKANFEVGGRIEFFAEGIDASISLTETGVQGATLKNGKEIGSEAMIAFDITDDMSEKEVEDAFSSWSGLDFLFDQEGSASIEIEITNNSDKNYIDVLLSKEIGASKNVTMTALNDNDGIQGLIYPNDSQIYTITFDVEDKDTRAIIDDFVVNFNMKSLTIDKIPSITSDEFADKLFFELDYSGENTAGVCARVSDEETGDYIYTSGLGDLKIPAYVKDDDNKIYTVTTILDYSFGGCKNLTSVVIPNTVNSIECNAFDGCTDLKSVQFPKSEVWIEGASFANSGLTSVVITENLYFVEDCYFDYCASLESVIFEEGCTKVSSYMFEGCVNLRSVTLTDTITNIYGYAFSECESLVFNKPSEDDAGNYLGTPSNPCFALVSFDDTVEEYEINENCQVIASYSFQDCTNLKSIVVPSGVKNLDNAFAYCASLENVRIKYGVTSIGVATFSDCTSLKNVHIPSSVTIIDYAAFFNCTSLESIVIPDSVTSIENQAFQYCTCLETITIPNNVTYIGWGAFLDCTSLKTVIVDSEEIASQLDGVGLGDCGGILANATTVKVLTSIVDSLGDYVLDNYFEYGTEQINGNSYTVFTQEKYDVGLSYNILTDEEGNDIGEVEVFWDGETDLTGTLVISETVIIDGKQYTVTALGDSNNDWGFQGCENLERIIIPETIERTYEPGLLYPENLVYNKISDDDVGCYLGTANNPYFLFVKVDAYVNQSYVIHEDCKLIGPEAFYGCLGLHQIEFYNVTKIEESAFDGCENLKDIEIPDSVTSIESYAFHNCTSLESINIPSSVTTIGDGAFSGCTSLVNINIPSNITNINSGTFQNCTSLESITIPSSVISIGLGAFETCSGLESIIVEDGNDVYDSRNNCNAIIETSTNTLLYGCKNTIIPEGVTSIGTGAFFGCTGLQSINIPSSVTSIGDQAFDCCKNLTSITIPEGVTSIEFSAFRDCTSLESITLSTSVTKIENWAFEGCTSLESITIPDSVTSIGSHAFDGCTSLESITIPDSVTSIGSSAFEGCTSLITIVVDSEAIASGLDHDFYGYLLWNAKIIKVKSSIVEAGKLNRYVPNQFKTVSIKTIDGISYHIYYNEGVVATKNGMTFNVDFNESGGLMVGWDGETELSGSIEFPSYVATIPVTRIETMSFTECPNITSVILPETLNMTADEATFPDSITFNKINENDAGRYLGTKTNPYFVLMSVDDTVTSYTVHEDCEIIWGESFVRNTNLQSVSMSNNVRLIGYYAFSRCTSLESVTLSTSVTKIEYLAFAHCTSLESITLSNSLTYIGQNVFTGCTNLKSIVLPDSVIECHDVFAGCTSLEYVKFGKNVEYISVDPFEECESLSTIVVDSEVLAEKLSGDNDETYTLLRLESLTTIKVLTSIVEAGKLHSYVTENFTVVTTEGEYTVYSKASA